MQTSNVIDFKLIVFDDRPAMENYALSHRDDRPTRDIFLMTKDRIYYVSDANGMHSVAELASSILLKYFDLGKYADWQNLDQTAIRLSPEFAIGLQYIH